MEKTTLLYLVYLVASCLIVSVSAYVPFLQRDAIFLRPINVLSPESQQIDKSRVRAFRYQDSKRFYGEVSTSPKSPKEINFLKNKIAATKAALSVASVFLGVQTSKSSAKSTELRIKISNFF